MARSQKLTESIKKLKKERNAIILAHVYQRSEVQDIADFVGDSFGLSEKAVNTKADVIVFAVKPQSLEAVMSSIPQNLFAKKVVISISLFSPAGEGSFSENIVSGEVLINC